jgi:fumarate reductase subunit D
MKTWKRSNAPIFWALFGGGGTLSSLFGPALVLVTGLAVPLGLLTAGTMGYERMLGLARHPLGKLVLFGLILLLAWHAMHRIYKSLHDVGVPPGTASKLVCYGVAMVITLMAGLALLRLGF